MAEVTVVSIEVMATKMVGAITKEVDLLVEFPRYLELLQAEYRRIQCFLEDLDSTAGQHLKLRWKALHAEDVIDSFLLDHELSKRIKGAGAFVRKKYKHWRGTKRIKREIDGIHHQLYQIHQGQSPTLTTTTSVAAATVNQLAPSYGHIEIPIENIIGLQAQTKKLLRKLTDEAGQNERRVITIVGMGGIGKSTLAWNAFKQSKDKSTFSINSWISITWRSGYMEIQVSTFSNSSPAEHQQPQELTGWMTQHLWGFCDSLKGKAYLVVLDNVWDSPRYSFLADLLNALPDDHNGSRIVITTRLNDVAVYASPQTYPIKMEHMNDGNSWGLFCERPSIKSTEDPVFQGVRKKILQQCGGLPLSIVSLCNKLEKLPPSRVDLENAYKQMEGSALQEKVLEVLEQSYHDLSRELQRCFLCMGFFPLNHIISARKLIHLWVAEGLINDQEGESKDVIAESHLDSLVEKNMVQPVEVGPDGKIKACQIDKSLHEFSIIKAKEEFFLEILKHENDNNSPQPSSYTRRQAIHHNSDRYFDAQKITPYLRSVMFIVPNGSISLKQLQAVCKRFKLLKLLHLENIFVGRLPDEIGYLHNLRYLNLRNTSIDNLPPVMCNLKKLLTLDIRDNMYVTGLDVIKHMTVLQNLYLPGFYEGLIFDDLTELQTFKWVRLASTESLESLAKLSKLRNLWIQLEGQLTLDEFLGSAAKLEKLESLHLYPNIEIASLDTDKFKCLTSLTKLYIKGGVRELPSPKNFPPNLMQLTLDGSGLIPFPLKAISKLPKLSTLRLRNLYIKGEKLVFSSAGFRRLKYLELLHLWNLKELELQGRGALKRLKHLKISNCLALSSLPHIAELSGLHIDKMKETFEKKIQDERGDGGRDRFQHLRSFNLTNTLKSYEEF